jgi:hypothetical protein
MAAKIHRSDAVRPTQRVEKSAVDPGRTNAKYETVQQDYGLTFARNQIMNVDTVGIEIAPLVTHGFLSAPRGYS